MNDIHHIELDPALCGTRAGARCIPHVEISFVLPCLDEAVTIGNCVKDCLVAIRSHKVIGEVIVADNGSADGSREIAKLAGARVVQVPDRGYGNALMTGIQAANGKYVVIGDSDMSYDFSEVPRFLNELRNGQELIVGCRMPRGGGTIQPGAMPWLHRWVGNPILSLLGRTLFQSSISDFHCGIRAFDRKRILALRLRASGMEFATEMIVKGSLAGLRIKEVPVTLRPDGRNREPHLRTWHDGWRHLRFMLLHAPRWLFLYPGLVIMFIATVIFIILVRNPIVFCGIQFDTNTLLISTVGILAGFEIVLMGLFSETFSRNVGLIPPNKLTDFILETGPFEKGIFIGGSVFFGGALCLLLAIWKWKDVNFGNLSYSDTLRLIIPAVVGMSLGIQIIFSGFFLAVIGLTTRALDATKFKEHNGTLRSTKVL